MGIYYQVYGIAVNKQKGLDWYLKNRRYANSKNMQFEFEYRLAGIY